MITINCMSAYEYKCMISVWCVNLQIRAYARSHVLLEHAHPPAHSEQQIQYTHVTYNKSTVVQLSGRPLTCLKSIQWLSNLTFPLLHTQRYTSDISEIIWPGMIALACDTHALKKVHWCIAVCVCVYPLYCHLRGVPIRACLCLFDAFLFCVRACNISGIQIIIILVQLMPQVATGVLRIPHNSPECWHFTLHIFGKRVSAITSRHVLLNSLQKLNSIDFIPHSSIKLNCNQRAVLACLCWISGKKIARDASSQPHFAALTFLFFVREVRANYMQSLWRCSFIPLA